MQTSLTRTQIAEMAQRERAALINSLSGFKSLNLVGTINSKGQTNLAIFNSVVHLGANPPLLALVVRPDSVERHTLENILETSYYTINHVNTAIYKQAHQTSARYPRSTSEFEACGLQSEFVANMPAPFVKESKVRLGMQLKQRLDIELNGTVLLIGEVVEVHFPTNAWCKDGYLDIEKAGTIAGSGLDSYHITQRFERLCYAKPDKELNSLVLNYFEQNTDQHRMV